MSKTDHARKPGSHSYLTRMDRRLGLDQQLFPTWEQVFNGNRRPAILASTEIGEVALPEAKPKCKSCGAELVRFPLTEWEITLREEEDFEDPCEEFCDYSCLEDWTVFHEDMEGEYVSETTKPGYDDYLARREAIDLDTDTGEGAYAEAWLPLMSIAEAREVFSGDFTIDSTNAERRYRKPAGAWAPRPERAWWL